MNNQNIAQMLQLLTLAAQGQVTATGNGAAVDLVDYEGEVAVVLAAKRSGADADETLNVKLQDSDDGVAGFADIAGAAFAQVTGAGASAQKLALKSDSCKRFIRAVDTVGGTTPQFERSITALGIKKYPA